MDNKKAIKAVQDFISSADKSLKNANKLLAELMKENDIDFSSDSSIDISGLHKYENGDEKVIEGVYTGEHMLGVDDKKYPIPANYCSKSKLVQGDKLKVTIAANGQMRYKQIAPIERKTIMGLLTKEHENYQVVAEGKTYDVLTAAVTHFGGEIGDTVAIIVPDGKEATFAAVDNILPKE
ncbi:hypothetical protein MK079_05215 [Candidatus Gracilibacteria bacterium]|nr:hypothetical protein [Candidatus Gracilibacteria bacterium]